MAPASMSSIPCIAAIILLNLKHEDLIRKWGERRADDLLNHQTPRPVLLPSRSLCRSSYRSCRPLHPQPLGLFNLLYVIFVVENLHSPIVFQNIYNNLQQRSAESYLALFGWYFMFLLSISLLTLVRLGAGALPTWGCHLDYSNGKLITRYQYNA